MADLNKLAVLLMAAGQSSRLGQPKQLIKYRGQALLLRQVQLALALNIQATCVLGYQAGLMKTLLTAQPIQILTCLDWQQGLSNSIATGVASLQNNVEAVLIFFVDQWCLQAQDLQQLITAWLKQPTRIVISKNCAQEMSPPVIFPRQCFSQLAQLSGDHGAKKVIKQNKHLVTSIELLNAFYDLDTPEQLALLNNKHNK